MSLRRRPAVDLRVLDGVEPAARPAVQVKLVDAGDLYVSWRWEHAPGEPRVTLIERKLVQPVLDDLARALPSPLPGEALDQALARALGDGALADRERELDLTVRLARSLLPYHLAAELNELISRGVRPHLRIQPSPSTAQVPWEALPGDEGERYVDIADVSALAPATVRNAPGRRVTPWDPGGPVVAALDPRVPGFGDGSVLGSVLGPVDPASGLATMVASWGTRLRPDTATAMDAFRRADIDRDVLEDLLDGAGRFLYAGHVSTAEHGLDARLHLSCTAATSGRAEPVGAHRPLTAADIALGHRPDDPRPWRMPNRVALIACESGGDPRFAEPSGLVAAMVHAGAEYVTAARWTLPTDAGLALLPGFAPDDDARAAGGVLAAAVVAVNDAHEAADPVAALAAWQRSRAERWRRTGDPASSPIVWGAFSTSYAPAPTATPG